MKTVQTEILLRPDSEALRFLPEGPYWLGNGRISWVGIQHGAASVHGSINILDLNSGTNQSWDLPGRPGFAFPTESPGVFVTGVERSVGLFNTQNNSWRPFIQDVESDVVNTIINDAVVFEDNLIFGCKELEFQTPKAGLYLWRRADGATIRLDREQICSNGKAVVRNTDGTLTLFDIDSCTKKIVKRVLNLESGVAGPIETVIDLTAESVFPDGMILTPDHRSLIVALYDPGDPAFGAARQYSLRDGSLETIWTCNGSPRVTCPQLVEYNGRIRLVLTTAVEHMSPEQQLRHPNAGCLFIGDTPFESLGDQPVFHTP
jgi:sugar lactone lactonase YvrE